MTAQAAYRFGFRLTPPGRVDSGAQFPDALRVLDRACLQAVALRAEWPQCR